MNTKTPAKRIVVPSTDAAKNQNEVNMFENESNPEELTLNTYTKLKSLKTDIRELKLLFNEKIKITRNEKYSIICYAKKCAEKLTLIHQKIPSEAVKGIDVDFDQQNEYIEFLEEKFNNFDFQFEDSHVDPIEIFSDSETIEKLLMNVDLLNAESIDETLENIRKYLLERLIYEQNQIVEKLNEKIDSFDEQIVKLKEEKLLLELDVKMKELYYLTVYQEFTILNNFESSQRELLNEIDKSTEARDQILVKLTSENQAENEYLSMAENVNEMIVDLDKTFNEFYQNNQNSELLDDFYKSSIIDESIKNMDLPPEVIAQINDVIDLRKRKIELQSKLKSINEQLESSKKKIAEFNQLMSEAEANLKANEYALNLMLTEKNKQLNNVETIVFLRKDQLKIDDQTTAEADNLDSYSLVNNDTITKLNHQINQLSIETCEQEEVQKYYVKQLAQVKTECNTLNSEMNRLRSETRDALVKKFGIEIDLDEMEETILTKLLVRQMDQQKCENTNVKNVKSLKKQLEDKEKEYLRLKQANVEKLNLLTALKEESNIIEEELRYQEKLRIKFSKNDGFQATNDLHRLKMISQQQQEQLKAIDREIYGLKMKSQPLEPITIDRNSYRNRFYQSTDRGYSFSSAATLREETGRSVSSAEEEVSNESEENIGTA